MRTPDRKIIKNARIIDPACQRDDLGNIYIEDGKIIAVDDSFEGFEAENIIDASGLWVLPGLVDLASYLRDPGADHKATIKSETYAAASAGITTLCFLPEPRVSVNSAANVNLINEINNRSNTAHIQVIGNLTNELKGNSLSNMGALKKAGCVGVSNGLQPMKNLHTLHMAMEYAVTHDLTVFIHPFEHSLAQKGCVHAGNISTRIGLPGIPTAAETAALAQVLTLVDATQAKTHFCRLSSAESVKLIEYGKNQGLPITADVAAHQLFLTEVDVLHFNPLCHTMPPLRTIRDREALCQGLADGIIDAICSDHQPHEIDAKLAPFQDTEPGISALETLLPLTLKLVEEGILDLAQALRVVTENPAKILGIPAGTLQEGQDASLVLFDPHKLWELNAENMLSAGKNTPFIGQGFEGQVISTLLAGEIVYSKEVSTNHAKNKSIQEAQ